MENHILQMYYDNRVTMNTEIFLGEIILPEK